MVKPEQDQEKKSKVDWLSEFTEKSLDNSAEVDIKPKLTIDGIGIEYSKDVVILSVPYKVEIPKEKAIGKDNKIWMIDLEFENVEHQFIAQSGSFRFQLGVLAKKLELSEMTKLINLPIKIWKQIATINTPTFKGKAEVYKISMM